MRKIRSRFKCFVVGIAMCELLTALPNVAQQTAAPPKDSFDVLSVKQVFSHSERAGGSSTTSLPKTIVEYQPDRIRCQLTLRDLIEEAYQVTDNEIDSPKWTNDQEHWFAIEGTMPPGTTKEAARLMLQQGLAERFGLQVHWEKRDTPVYALVPGRNGVKLQPVDDPEHPKLRTYALPNGKTAVSGVHNEAGVFFAAAITMDGLAQNLQVRAGLDRPIVNMTGLTGVYTIDLRWFPPEPPTYVDPAILQAVEKQLGLRLEKRTLPFNVLVVDHAEGAPSAN
ncbi:MAG: TIGR03435 family protein [Candidatus Acidiferrales bacterium]